MAEFRMLDAWFKEFDRLYDVNKAFFCAIDNWFYFANDEKKSIHPGCVRYASQDGFRDDSVNPNSGNGAVVCFLDSTKIKKIKNKCQKETNGLLRFKLKDGKSNAYISVFKNLDGTECVGFVIKNNPKTYDFPFTLGNNLSYNEACKEEGTLPNMIETDKILDLIPNEILKLCGIGKNSKKLTLNKEALREIKKINEEIAELNEKLDELKRRKRGIIRGKEK